MQLAQPTSRAPSRCCHVRGTDWPGAPALPKTNGRTWEHVLSQRGSGAAASALRSHVRTGQARTVSSHCVVPLRGVVAAAIHTLRERIKETAAEIHVQDQLPSAMGDFSALQQVVQNLIGNAVQYRRQDASPSVTIGARQDSSDDWVISISDNGIGVAKQYQEAIFAPFKRLHGLEIPGAGMGLAICKQIVEALGGRIWVESEPGCGASFFFTLRSPS